jgi:DNA-directed RNA polymerase specialized sigma24 family protein
MNRPLLAHVGCGKTGTSSLQAGLWKSVADIEAAGVGVPYVGRKAHRRGFLNPFGWRVSRGFVDAWNDAALERITPRLRNAAGERVLISNEDLVELDPPAIERLEKIDAELAKIVELRAFGGLTIEEAAHVLSVSPSTAKRDWRTAKAWLNRELGSEARP